MDASGKGKQAVKASDILTDPATLLAYLERLVKADGNIVKAVSLQDLQAGTFLTHTQRFRKTIAQVNAGATLLAALTGYKYQLVDVLAIAIGGAVGTLTTVDLLATQAAAGVKLAAFAQASLTQSTVLRPGVAGCTVLADCASFAPNDAATAIAVGKTGGTGDTATHVDFIVSYAIVRA